MNVRHWTYKMSDFLFVSITYLNSKYCLRDCISVIPTTKMVCRSAFVQKNKISDICLSPCSAPCKTFFDYKFNIFHFLKTCLKIPTLSILTQSYFTISKEIFPNSRFGRTHSLWVIVYDPDWNNLILKCNTVVSKKDWIEAWENECVVHDYENPSLSVWARLISIWISAFHVETIIATLTLMSCVFLNP